MASHFICRWQKEQDTTSVVLMQDTPAEKYRTILAYYSTKLDKVEQGLPPCCQGLAATSFVYQKAPTLIMGHPVTVYTSHQLHGPLKSPRFVLNQARKTGYDVILATKMVLPSSGTPCDCTKQTKNKSRHA